MKKYMVAYMSYFDNKLIQEQVEACSQFEACFIMLQNKGYDMSEVVLESYEELKQFAWDCDTAISAEVM